MKKHRFLAALVVLHLAITGALALVNPHALLIDDAYYTLTIARNIATGQGITYGGFPTNGFQPLYAFVIAPLLGLFPGYPDLCLRLALLLMTICSAALLVVIYRLTERLAGPHAAAIAGLLYAANATLIGQLMSGLETPLHGLLFWGFVALYLRWRDTDAVRQLAVLGVLLALTAYARFDTVFLFLAVGVDLVNRDSRRPARFIRRGLSLFGPALALLAPWFVWCRVTFGTFAQSSGEFHRWRGLVRQDLPDSLLGMLQFGLAKLVSLGVKLPLEAVGWEGTSRTAVGRLLGIDRPQTGLLIELALQRPLVAGLLSTALVGLLWLAIRHGRAGWRNLRQLSPLSFLWPTLAGAAVYYPLYQLNYSMRHFFPYGVGMVMVVAVFAAGVLGSWPANRALRAALAVLLLAATAGPGLGVWITNADDRVPRRLIATLEMATPAGSRIGYTDCGVFGYYVRGRTIVNLDGILNFEAQREMRAGDIGAYLLRHRIQYVLYLHNFRAEFAQQWDETIAPRALPVAPTDWIYRMVGPPGS